MPIGSYAPLRTSVSLISGGTTIPLRTDQYLQGMQVELVCGGAWTGTVSLFDRQGDYLESLIVAAGTSRAIEFSFGRGASYPGENITFRGSITRYKPTFDHAGIHLEIDCVASGTLEAVLDRRILAFSDGQRISDIFQKIADTRGWPTSDAQGRSTIEPTRDVVKQPFNSNGESDLAFVRKYLVPQAINGSNVGNYLFYFDEANAVHFHTPSFLPAVSHNFTFARSISGDVVSFSPEDTTLFGYLLGGGNTIFGGLSSLNGAAAQATSTTTGGVENEGFPVTQDGGGLTDWGLGIQSYVDIVTRDVEELQRIAQSRFDKFREYGYKATMEVMGTHRVALTDFINFHYVKHEPLAGTPPDHYLSGLFRTFKISHSVSPGSWMTTYEMLRQGTQLAGTNPAQGTQTISPSVAQNGGAGIGVSVDRVGG